MLGGGNTPLKHFYHCFFLINTTTYFVLQLSYITPTCLMIYASSEGLTAK